MYKKVGAPRFKIKQVNTTSINITGLKPATNYIFFVRSYCSWYNIGRSVKGTFRTLDGCDKPTNLSVEEITSTSAKLIWSKIDSATDYIIEYKKFTGAINWKQIGPFPATDSFYIITSLLPDTKYAWRVKAKCPDGTTEFGNISNFTTLPLGDCPKPINLSVTSITSSSALLNWNLVSGSNGYIIKYKKKSAANWITIDSIDPSINSYQLNGLLPNTIYTYKVQSICPQGSSFFSQPKDFTTLGLGPCDVPSAIAVSNISTTSATISWTGDVEATSYELQYKEISNPNWQSVIINAPTTTYTFSNLIQNTTYQYRLKTVCSFGESVFSSIGEFTTLTAPVCDVPSAITVSNISTTSATISWTGDVEATSYELQYKELSNPNWQSVIINAPTTTYAFSNLIQTRPINIALKQYVHLEKVYLVL
ncbi:MAG: fibronectin type III domain-containing protein [Bacteroidetes bacterium]|nr:fibronectin type III domain-containing protein [Bacteroidota bacterium]